MKRFYLFLTFALMGLTSLSAKPAVADANGKLPCQFSVSATQKVYFSQGNLQYIGSAATPYWKFAEEQYAFLGTSTGQNSDAVNVDRDLLGWGTGDTPNNVSTNNDDYSWYEWGENSIYVGEIITSAEWRTLSCEEWTYLISERSNYDHLRTLATVNNVSGLIILPDDWNGPSIACTTSDYSSRTYTIIQWESLELYGAVFLPAAGLRYGTNIIQSSYMGYWSTSLNGTGKSAFVLFKEGNTFSTAGQIGKAYGMSVRLVKNATSGDPTPTASVTAAPAANTLTYTGSAQALVSAGTASGGTMMYKLSTAANYSASIPTATNAGTYYVNYMVEGTGCFNDFTPDPNTIEVTIAQADYTPSGSYSISGNNLSYTGSSQALVSVTGSVTDGTIWYKLGDGDWTTEIPTAATMGDYHVWYKVVPSNSNYKDTEPVEVLASITIPTVTDNSDAATINAVLALNPTDLMVERTIYRNGEYNTICLPFALDASALAASPLAGFNNLKTIKGASVTGSGQALSIDIFVEDVTEMEAGKPYLISYPSANENIVNPVFTGITVTTTEPGSVTADGITFRGMFAQVHIDPYTAERDEDYLFLGANSQLMWPNNDGSSMRGFRAYFIIDRTVITPAAAPSGTRARFVNAPKQPTGIENTELNTQAQKLLENGQLIILKNGIKYNAQGQVLK